MHEESRPLVSVIVPTLNERENLAELVTRLDEAMRAAALTSEIVIVDDASPDGTLEEARRLVASHPVLPIERRGPRSLSLAVLDGIFCSRGEVVVVMDADLSHPPEVVPKLVEEILRGAEFAIGSRFVAGGSTDDSWGRFRRVNSWVASVFARPLVRLTDPMAGFFATRRAVLQRAPSLSPVGYKIGLELLVKCAPRRIVEVPIHFASRTRGHSKLTLHEQMRYLRHLGRLYAFRLGQSFRRWLSFREAPLALPAPSIARTRRKTVSTGRPLKQA